MRGQPAEVTYEEGIYTGYRYYNTFNVPVSYEFGYGLSYTTFEYSNLKISSQTFSKPVMVSVDVKNTGKVAGKDIRLNGTFNLARNLTVKKISVALVPKAKISELKPN